MSIQDSLTRINNDFKALTPGTKGVLVATTDGKKLTVHFVRAWHDGTFKLTTGLEQEFKKQRPTFYVGITKEFR